MKVSIISKKTAPAPYTPNRKFPPFLPVLSLLKMSNLLFFLQHVSFPTWPILVIHFECPSQLLLRVSTVRHVRSNHELLHDAGEPVHLVDEQLTLKSMLPSPSLSNILNNWSKNTSPWDSFKQTGCWLYRQPEETIRNVFAKDFNNKNLSKV